MKEEYQHYDITSQCENVNGEIQDSLLELQAISENERWKNQFSLGMCSLIGYQISSDQSSKCIQRVIFNRIRRLCVNECVKVVIIKEEVMNLTGSCGRRNQVKQKWGKEKWFY